MRELQIDDERRRVQRSRRAHNPKVAGSYPAPATKIEGPGIAWAFVLSGADFAAQLTDNTFPSCALTPEQDSLLAKHLYLKGTITGPGMRS